MCGHFHYTMEQNSCFVFIAKPVLHSWEATKIGNKAYAYREAINQLNRIFFKLKLTKLNTCINLHKVEFHFNTSDANELT